MKRKTNRKKILLSLTAAVLVAALGAGIFFGTRGGDPVAVYDFNMVGMTEYWGDSQESYGPVSTDNIQTTFLSDTQTVTEYLVKEGDEVKKGDALIAFDTSLTELELERKRLEVEKLKLDLQSAEAELKRIRNLVPMDPDAINALLQTEKEPVLGDAITGEYEISEKVKYDGSEVSLPLILWMKDGTALTNGILREVYEKALTYQQTNQAGKPETSASAVPVVLTSLETGNPEDDPEGQNKQEEQKPQDGQNGPESGLTLPGPEDKARDSGQEEGEEAPTISMSITCNNTPMEDQELTAGENGYVIPSGYTYQEKTYWFRKAVRISDGAELVSRNIPACPETEAQQAQWDELWGAGVSVYYIRETTLLCDKLSEEESILTAEPETEVTVSFFANFPGVPAGGKWNWTVTGNGTETLSQTPKDNFLLLSGTTGKTEGLTLYTVKATYTFDDNGTSRAVAEEFAFALEVKKPGQSAKKNDFYMILKVTQDNMERGERLIWQGLHVMVYEDGSFGFQLFDASALEDHTLEPLEEEETPVIDFGSGMTAAEIAKLRKEQEQTVKNQTLSLGLAEANYKIMQAEVNDGKIYAEFDGTVVSLLTEEEAREQNKPVVKVSGGGGFLVEGSVSELMKDEMKVGQEVTVMDWNSGGSYTGVIRSISDFPNTADGWMGAGNPNASYYPFVVFIDGSADLQAYNYVSITYSSGTAENGIYLENPFLRTEEGVPCVYVRGGDGRLERREVTVGKSLWGSYTEILSGLTEEDMVAFPYGKNVKVGAKTEEGDLADLYTY